MMSLFSNRTTVSPSSMSSANRKAGSTVSPVAIDLHRAAKPVGDDRKPGRIGERSRVPDRRRYRGRRRLLQRFAHFLAREDHRPASGEVGVATGVIRMLMGIDQIPDGTGIDLPGWPPTPSRSAERTERRPGGSPSGPTSTPDLVRRPLPDDRDRLRGSAEHIKVWRNLLGQDFGPRKISSLRLALRRLAKTTKGGGQSCRSCSYFHGRSSRRL